VPHGDGKRERHQERQAGRTAAPVVMVVSATRIVAPEVLQRQVGQRGRVRRPEAREERTVVRVEELDQYVVAAARVSRFELGHDDELVVAGRAVDTEVLGDGILVPRPSLEAQVEHRVHVGELVDRVGIEQQVDPVEIAVAVVVAEQHDVGVEDPEVVPGRPHRPAGELGASRRSRGRRRAGPFGIQRVVAIVTHGGGLAALAAAFDVMPGR